MTTETHSFSGQVSNLKQAAKQFRRRLKRECAGYTPDAERRAQTVENFIDALIAHDCRAMASPPMRADALKAIDEFDTALRA